ncbi:MAG: hypothetical protein FWF86_01630 [Clostridia bacterium]|nr:hypothetical protein [Clostridia bacterium]
MSRFYRSLAALVLLIVLCASGSFAVAGMPETPIPGVGSEDFDAALREDRLTLAPVPLPGLPEDAQLLSLSPDGSRLLLLTDSGLSVFTVADGAVLPLTPLPGEKCKLTDETIGKMFDAPEVNAVSWSADGEYLSFGFPRRTILEARYDTNLWIANLETGAIEPFLDLPESIRVTDPDMPDVPLRAMFDRERPLLYYDLLTPSRDIEYFSWDYRADITTRMGGMPLMMMMGPVNPALMRIGEHLVMNAVDRNPSEGSGLIAMSGGAAPVMTLETGEGFLTRFLGRARLIDARDRAALLECFDISFDASSEQDESLTLWTCIHLMECALNEKGEAQYGAFLGVNINLPAESRLLRVTAGDLDKQEAREALFRRFQREEIALFANAAFSPGGDYALLAISGPSCSLYVLNRGTGECGYVGLPEGFTQNHITFARSNPVLAKKSVCVLFPLPFEYNHTLP